MGRGNRSELHDVVWDIVQGCSPVGDGCRYCTASNSVHRLSRHPSPKLSLPLAGLTTPENRGTWTGKVAIRPERLGEPLRWARPRRVSVAPLGDLFYPGVGDEFLLAVFRAMHKARQHCYLISTKYPERMREFSLRLCLDEKRDEPYLATVGGRPYLPLARHVALGVSFEDQETADRRLPWLMGVDCRMRVAYYEPALGSVDLMAVQFDRFTRMNVLEGVGHSKRSQAQSMTNARCKQLGFVVASGEIGPSAREVQVGWLRGVRDQCRDAGVPFHLRRMGTNVWEGAKRWMLMDFTGSEPAEWPDGLFVREFPETKEVR